MPKPDDAISDVRKKLADLVRGKGSPKRKRRSSANYADALAQLDIELLAAQGLHDRPVDDRNLSDGKVAFERLFTRPEPNPPSR
jgi:hypothetical protein